MYANCTTMIKLFQKRDPPKCINCSSKKNNVDDDDLEETAADDAHREEAGAMDKAANMFECINMPQKKCHCVCNGQPCISQFSDENQESIRYAMFNYYKACALINPYKHAYTRTFCQLRLSR